MKKIITPKEIALKPACTNKITYSPTILKVGFPKGIINRLWKEMYAIISQNLVLWPQHKSILL